MSCSAMTSLATPSISFLIIASSWAKPTRGTMTSGTTVSPELRATSAAASKIARACIS